MHVPHPVFNPPPNPDVPIWRYMDLAKFLSMLETKALHFSRSDKMEDVFEGSISRPTREYRRDTLFNGILDEIGAEQFDALNESWASGGEKFRRYVYLSCWHMNLHESVAMWKIYLSGESGGIAIRSTYPRLSESIIDERAVYISTVEYVDYEADVMPENDAIQPYLHKRKSFKYERELRAIHVVPKQHVVSEGNPPTIGWAPEGDEKGIDISVDLDTLVETVYVSPKARAWFEKLVRDVLKRYGKSWRVEYSSIDGKPTY